MCLCVCVIVVQLGFHMGLLTIFEGAVSASVELSLHGPSSLASIREEVLTPSGI